MSRPLTTNNCGYGHHSSHLARAKYRSPRVVTKQLLRLPPKRSSYENYQNGEISPQAQCNYAEYTMPKTSTTMPGFIVTYTYKKASHVDHSKPPKAPQQKIGQEIGAYTHIARTSRSAKALTCTLADLREP